MIKSIAVFCGSASGKNDIYTKEAVRLANIFIEKNIKLIYGGGSVGLMGVIANEMIRKGGHVEGVIPQKLLDMEVGHLGITKLHVVDTMHERKALMAELSEAFIALPGGIGTLEEIVEVYTWLQLGYHHKPCGFLNVNGYYDTLFRFFDQMVAEGFLKPQHRENLLVNDDISALIEEIQSALRAL